MKKINIIIKGLLVSVLFIGILVYWVLNKKNYPGEKNPEDEFSAEEIYNIYLNNYKLSYLLMGDVGTAEGFIEIEDKKYYYLEDEVLSIFNTIDDINKIIDETFTTERQQYYKTYLGKDYFNQYVEINNHLYVYKRQNPCLKYPGITDKDFKLVNKNEDRYEFYDDLNVLYVVLQDEKVVSDVLMQYCPIVFDEDNNK